MIFIFITIALSEEAISSESLRIAYIEGGNLGDYKRLLYGIVRGFNNLGITKIAFDDNFIIDNIDKDSWVYFSKFNDQGKIKFIKNGYYSADWNQDRRISVIKELQERLDKVKDIDLIIAMGTWAGQDVLKLKTNIPILISCVSDPQEAGIISHIIKNNQKNFLVGLEPGFYERQFEFFYEILKFKKLGIIYENTKTGRSMAAISQITAKAEDLNIDLYTCYDANHDSDLKTLFDRRIYCNRKFVEANVDAVYITYDFSHMGNLKNASLEPLIISGIPTFSQVGANDVKNGILIGLTDTSFEEGHFYADIIHKILNENPLWNLNLNFYRPLSLSFNVKTASIMGFNPSLPLLLRIDKVFD